MFNIRKFVEDEVTEFKKTTGEVKEALISIGAILNKHHKGILYFGINDLGQVIGQEVSEKTLRTISEAIANKIEPKIYPKVNNIIIDNKECIMVEFEGSDTPYLVDGRAYIRVSDQDRKLSIYEMRKMLKKSEENKWDKEKSDKKVEDVNEEVLIEYIEKASESGRINFKYTEKSEVLTKLGLLDGEYLLNAGKMLFCDDNNLNLQVATFATNTKTTFIDYNRYTGNIFKLVNLAFSYISNNIIWNVKITNKREEYPEIPLNCIREAIINSFAHKLYTDPKGVEVSIFKDRVEIYNPGTFPEEYTPEDYINKKAHSVLRNPLIANLMYKSQYGEGYSSGIERMYNECKKNKTKIEFQLEAYGFTIKFYRKNAQSLINNMENDLAEIKGRKEEKKRLKIDIEMQILNKLKFDNTATKEELARMLEVSLSTIERKIKELKDKGTIERRGTDKSGYWIIKRDGLNDGVNDGVNDGLNDGVNDGLNSNNIEERILNKLKFDYMITKEALAKSLNVSISTIERNIKKLKDKGIIERKGSRKNGYWKIKI